MTADHVIWDYDAEHEYDLLRVWNPSLPVLTWVMLNPSMSLTA